MKRLCIGRNAAASIACLAAITRVFFGITIDSPELYNSGWLSIPLGAILCVPFFLCVQKLWCIQDNIPPKKDLRSKLFSVTFAILAVNSLMDGAIIARCVSNSANYAVFNSAIRFFLILPLFIATYWALYCNGSAIGAGGRIWSKLLPSLIVVVVLAEISEFRFSWLTPILGPGMKRIINGAFKTAGWISGVAGILIVAEVDMKLDKRTPCLIKELLVIAVASTVLVVIRMVMAPAMLSSLNRTRIYRLDFMLTNGRAPLTLQLPLLIIWFISLFNLMACHCFISAKSIQMIFPRIKGKLCAIVSVVATAAISMSVFTDYRSGQLFAQWQFVLNGIVIALGLLILIVPGGNEKCAGAI